MPGRVCGRHAHSGSRIPGAHPVDPSPAQLAILSFTLKLCALLLLIFKFIPQVFIAPYAFIEMSFWAQVALVLLLQGAFFAVMRRLTWLHPRPYLFFALMYFPAAGLYLAVENSLAPFIALVNVGLSLLTLGGVALGRRTGGA